MPGKTHQMNKTFERHQESMGPPRPSDRLTVQPSDRPTVHPRERVNRVRANERVRAREGVRTRERVRSGERTRASERVRARAAHTPITKNRNEQNNIKQQHNKTTNAHMHFLRKLMFHKQNKQSIQRTQFS